MPRVAITNHKGGSGKTAATINLAAALAGAGYRVLVVDLDPRANASRRLGVRFDPEAPTLTISEVIEASKPGVEGTAGEALTAAAWPGVYGERVELVPSRFDLENRISEAATVGAVGRLRRALAGVDDTASGYALTLIDCPPSLGHLTQLALAAADTAVATIDPEYDSVEGALRVRDFIDANAGELGNPGLRLGGVVVGRVRSNLGAHAFQLDGLPEAFGDGLVWSPHVPERAVIKDAADSATPLPAMGGVAAASVAEVYGELAARLLKEVGA